MSDDIRYHVPRHLVDEADEPAGSPPVSPGKRTLTMSLPPRSVGSLYSAQAPVQRSVDPAASAASDEWLSAAVRPDLHGAPIVQRMAAGEGGAPGISAAQLAEEEAEGDRDNNDADAEAPVAAAAAAGPGDDAGEDDGADVDDGEDAGIEAEEEDISDEEIAAEVAAAGPVPEGEPEAAGEGAPAQARAGAGGLHMDAALPPSSAGAALPAQLRASMERSFQTDFSTVQVHADSPRAASLGALAYTEGSSVHIAPGQYDPSSKAGRELLGHELTHVVQQRAGRVSATGQAKGVAVNEDPALEREADDLGRRAAGGEVVRSAGLGVRDRLGAVQMARPVVQMARTHWGNFRSVSYHSLRAGRKAIGVEMFLRFRPGRHVDAKQIGLVQAVRSAEAGAPLAINPTVTGRSIPAADASPMRSAVGTDEGFHIDQSATNRNPLYAVEGAPAADANLSQGPTPGPVTRMTRAQRRAEAARTGVTGVRYEGWGSHGHRFKDGRRWKTKSAELHDTPQLPARTKNAEQIFETTALATDGAQNGTYYGSVQWGWRTNDKGRFRRLPFRVLSQGVPTSTFMKAAEIWNPGTTSAGVANLPLPVVDVHVLTARTRLNPGLRGQRHTRLRRGTRVEVLDRAVAQPDGRVLARIRVVDGSRTGLEGLVDPALLRDERA